MRRALRPAGVAVAAALLLVAWLLAGSPAPSPEEDLPALGTRLAALPDGAGKEVADQACLNCHSADLMRQQKLTEKQWSASVDKMIGWGAVVPAGRKNDLVAYLFEHFGPDNDRFRPVVARPPER